MSERSAMFERSNAVAAVAENRSAAETAVAAGGTERKPILEVQGVSRVFPASGGRKLYANNKISLEFFPGETLGIVGESGCGKSTLMRMLVFLDQPTEGRILFRGQDLSGLKQRELWTYRRNIQMIFQDPARAFNPKMRVSDIICEPLLNFGMIRPSEKKSKAKELLEMVELPAELADRYPHNMSGGQRQRVGIARAFSIKPDVVLCDEATSALDVSVQKRVLELLVRLQKENDISMGFICHDVALVSQMSHRTAVMYLGHIMEILPSQLISTQASHPYTQALMGALFDLNMDYSKKIESIESEIPSPLDAPSGCPFRDRCPHVMERCATEQPVLKEIGPGHQIACHLF